MLKVLKFLFEATSMQQVRKSSWKFFFQKTEVMTTKVTFPSSSNSCNSPIFISTLFLFRKFSTPEFQTLFLAFYHVLVNPNAVCYIFPAEQQSCLAALSCTSYKKMFSPFMISYQQFPCSFLIKLKWCFSCFNMILFLMENESYPLALIVCALSSK